MDSALGFPQALTSICEWITEQKGISDVGEVAVVFPDRWQANLLAGHMKTAKCETPPILNSVIALEEKFGEITGNGKHRFNQTRSDLGKLL